MIFFLFLPLAVFVSNGEPQFDGRYEYEEYAQDSAEELDEDYIFDLLRSWPSNAIALLFMVSFYAGVVFTIAQIVEAVRKNLGH